MVVHTNKNPVLARNFRTSMIALVYLVVLAQVTAALGEESPFLSQAAASQILGRRDLGRYRELSAQLGLRTDIGEGWEELLRPTTNHALQRDIMAQLYSVVDPSWFEDEHKQKLANKILFGSIAGLDVLKISPPQMTNSQQNTVLG